MQAAVLLSVFFPPHKTLDGRGGINSGCKAISVCVKGNEGNLDKNPREFILKSFKDTCAVYSILRVY